MDRERWVESAKALLELDAKGKLVPHGIGGLARELLEYALAAGLAQEWQPIETAPKVVDETVLLRIEHINFAIATGGDKRRWEEAVTAYWTDFNGGGWVWHGLAGTPTHWARIQPLPPSPNQAQSQ